MTMKPFRAVLPLLLAAIVLPGCVSVLPEAAPAAPRYLIDPVAFEASSEPPVEWSIAVEDPMATRVYDNTKIALVREPGRVEYYANGEWADRAPRLVQAALIRSFENNGRILGVGDRTSLPISNFVLQTDIRAMQAEYEGAQATAHFSVFVRLGNGRSRIFAAKLFEAKVPAERGDVASIAAAFDSAVGAVIGDIVDWSIEEANAAYAK